MVTKISNQMSNRNKQKQDEVAALLDPNSAWKRKLTAEELRTMWARRVDVLADVLTPKQPKGQDEVGRILIREYKATQCYYAMLEDAQALQMRFVELRSYAKTLDCQDEAKRIEKQFDPRAPAISAEKLQELTATLTKKLRGRRQLRIVRQE